MKEESVGNHIIIALVWLVWGGTTILNMRGGLTVRISNIEIFTILIVINGYITISNITPCIINTVFINAIMLKTKVFSPYYF